MTTKTPRRRPTVSETAAEGQVFECRWKREGKFYRVWVKRRPSLAAKGKTFRQADHRLWAVIIHATGDGESVRAYQPPAPESAQSSQMQPMDLSAWVARLKQHTRRRRKREPLGTRSAIERQFAQRVHEHFAFLPELGLRGPRLSRVRNAVTGTTFRARFASKKRTLDIDLDKAHREYSNGVSFTISVKPPVADPFESFMSVMYFQLRHRALGELLAELETTHTLDDIMALQFPLYADLFRGELRPLLTAEQWHDEYQLYRE